MSKAVKLWRQNNSLTAKSGVEPERPHAVHHLRIHSPARLPAANPTSSCLHRVWHLGWRGLRGDGGSAGPQWQSVRSRAARRPAAVWKCRDSEESGDQRSVRRDGSHWLRPRRSNCTKVPRWRLSVIPAFHRKTSVGKMSWGVKIQNHTSSVCTDDGGALCWRTAASLSSSWVSLL